MLLREVAAAAGVISRQWRVFMTALRGGLVRPVLAVPQVAAVSGRGAPGGPAFFSLFFLRLFVRTVAVVASAAGGAGTEHRGRSY